MTDVLLELSKNPLARKLVASAKLPIPMPQKLERLDGPFTERFLEGRSVFVAGSGAGSRALSDVLARSLSRAGATTSVDSDALADVFASAAEAYGRPVQRLAPAEGDATSDDRSRPYALVFDASALTGPAELKPLYAFLQAQIGRLASSGRVLVLARPSAEAATLSEACARQALEGFVRSVAKEIGGKGATANLLIVSEGAEARATAALRFLLSPASAFVSAQPLYATALASWDSQDEWERPLANKVALVTGAARGIGAATAKALAREGARVVCLDRPEDDEPLSIVARDIGGAPLLVDVADPSAAARIANELKSQYGGVDVVIHNAGITRDRRLVRMPEGTWDQVIDINLLAPMRITEALLEHGALRDAGRIVSLSSVAGLAGNNGQTNYAASKAGVVGFTRFFAAHLRERGVTVNAVAPGFIETRMTHAIPLVVREAGRRLSALGQGGLPEDVAETILFLSLPGSAGITGQVLRVCGGALIGA
jgi:3-oxoacyl-[acyl-carrier protein] reductase